MLFFNFSQSYRKITLTSYCSLSLRVSFEFHFPVGGTTSLGSIGSLSSSFFSSSFSSFGGSFSSKSLNVSFVFSIFICCEETGWTYLIFTLQFVIFGFAPSSTVGIINSVGPQILKVTKKVTEISAEKTILFIY